MTPLPDLGTTPRRTRPWLVAVVAIACLSAVLVVAPTPTVVSAAEVEVHTEHIRMTPRRTPRTGEAIGVAATASVEARGLHAALAAPGRRTSPRRTGALLAVGISLPAPPDGPVLVRGHVDGAWTPWFELSFDDGEGPDRTDAAQGLAGVHSEPVWLGEADAYELDAPASVTEVDVHRIGEGPAHRQVALAQPSAGAAGAPGIQPRSAWGAAPPTVHPSTTADLKLAIVHHSVNGNTYSAAQVPQLIRSVQAYHRNVRGWGDIAYNIVVDRFGRAWEGRAGGLTNVVFGGHSKGFNTGTLGVVVLGDYRSATPSAATVETIARVIAWKFALHRVDPASTVRYTSAGSAKYPEGQSVTLPRIVGHRDVQSTDCPGGHLYARLGAIRRRVAELVPSYQAGLAPLVLEPDVTGDGLVDPIQYQPGRTGDVQWTASPEGTLTRRATSINGAFQPVTGDFDGDGRTDIVWHGTGSAADYLWWSNTSGTTSQRVTVNGSYAPVSGDFDGNGVDDILWYATGLAPDSVWYFQADRTYVSRAVTQDLSTGVALAGDFDGNGIDDVFFYGPGTADDRLWRGRANRTFAVSSPTVNGWYAPAVLDATGDGQDEILWYAPGEATSHRWEFRADGSISTRALTTSVLLGRPIVGDFDGDGRDDALIVASGTAPDAVWYSTATGIDQHAVAVNGSYGIAVGPMDVVDLEETDDLLYVSATGTDHLWLGDPDRTFTSTAVG